MHIWFSLLVAAFGFAAQANLSVYPSNINFGTLEEGDFTRSRMVTVQNTGREATRVRVSGSCSGNISATDNCFFELDSFNTCTITFRFRPQRVGSSRCSVQVSSQNGGFSSVTASGWVRERRN